MEFHVIPWNCSCQRNWRTLSSMEFRGTARVIEIGALLVPWNSMELLVSSKLAHHKFLGIPWNCSCQRNWRTSSSMEYHETARVIELGALLVPWNPWNSMELLVSSKLVHSKFHGIAWNSMELLVSTKLTNFKFHGIPWNCSCYRNWHIPSSMEFHGTARVIEIGALLIPWNSMEFQWTARVIEIGALQVPWNSMELVMSSKLAHFKFHGIPWNYLELLVSAKLAHSNFHGIPWNCWCQRNLAHLNFHGIPWNCSCHRNWRTSSSMEFHGTARVIEIGTLEVSWNSIELLLSVPWSSWNLLFVI